MKRALFLLLPAVLLVLIALVGCTDETNPKFTRLKVYPDCGIAPMNIEGLAIISGGDESGDPTGGNNNLEISWDFDDGSNGSTSITYHTFEQPGEFNIVVTGTDPDGKTTTISHMVQVLADTMSVAALTNFSGGTATVNDTVRFDVLAQSCEIDPDNDNDYRNLIFDWDMNDGTDTHYESRRPRYQFTTAGTYDVMVSVTFPAMAISRRDTVQLVITGP